jgi:hypothetical protein
MTAVGKQYRNIFGDLFVVATTYSFEGNKKVVLEPVVKEPGLSSVVVPEKNLYIAWHEVVEKFEVGRRYELLGAGLAAKYYDCISVDDTHIWMAVPSGLNYDYMIVRWPTADYSRTAFKDIGDWRELRVKERA